MPIFIADLVRGMRRRETIVPVALVLIAGLGIVCFLILAHEMTEGALQHFDEAVLLMLRTPGDIADPRGPEWLEEVALEITAIGGYPLVTLSVLAVAGFLVVARHYGPALYVSLSVASGALVSTAMKYYFDRPRPDLVAHLDRIHTPSFPSGHALVTTVAYLTLAALIMRFVDDRRVRVYVLCVAVTIALMVGVSRIYLGVHWPSDVIAGWALGTAWACLSWLVVSALQIYRGRDR